MLAEDLPQFLSSRDGGPGEVYVILANRYLKIGHSRDPLDRLRSVRRSTPERLKLPYDVNLSSAQLMWSIPGSRDDERRLQHVARNYWVHGEWYYTDPQLVRGLAELRRGSNA